MNLCIDIGNNQTSVGLFKNGRMVSSKSILNNEIPKKLDIYLKNGGFNVKEAIISSVVPNIYIKTARILRNYKSITIKTISHKLIKGMRFNYKNINKLGKDRIINAFGAYHLMGGGCLVADFGTAVTYDYISKKRVFEGGLILPGLSTALESLNDKTALLPKVSLKGPVAFPGRSTEACMRAGVLKGYAALTRGIREDFKKKFRLKRCILIVTGGHTRVVQPYLKDLKNVVFDPYFTLRSMDALLRAEG